MYTLYISPGSSSLAAHIALREVGAAFELKPVPIADKATRTPAYLAINPEGKVPALLIEGRVLTEVAGILWYLARRHPEAGLLPAGDAEAEARVVSWMSFLASAVHPAIRQGAEHAREIWSIAERRMAGREWVMGTQYSIADIHLFRLFWRFKGPAELTPEAYPALTAHLQRMLARPAVQAAMAAEGV